MKVIVPVDFSGQSINTAVFASQMLNGIPGAELVLYHRYQEESQRALVQQNLQKLKERLQNKSFVAIRCLAEKGNNFIKALNKLLYREDAALVVMCVGDTKVFEESNAVQVLAQNRCPVLVIPNGYLYNKIKTVALASDLNDVRKTIPLEKVKNVLNVLKPQLYIAHVSPVVDVFYNDELLRQRKQLEEMFQEYQPQFHFIPCSDFATGLHEFMDFREIDLVLTFPRKHNLLTTFLKGTNTRKLVYKRALPVLAAHE